MTNVGGDLAGAIRPIVAKWQWVPPWAVNAVAVYLADGGVMDRPLRYALAMASLWYGVPIRNPCPIMQQFTNPDRIIT